MQRRLQPPENYKDEIDNWVQFAMNKKVQKLDIDITLYPNWGDDDSLKLYLFPCSLFTNQDKGYSALINTPNFGWLYV